MSGVAEIGASMMKVSERRLEGVSQNVSNVQTPGYQSVTSFQTELKCLTAQRNDRNDGGRPAGRDGLSHNTNIRYFDGAGDFRLWSGL